MDDEFKLCWKNFQDNIASGFQNLYDRGDLVDVTLACDGKLLHAHKIVLAICSPYFQEIFITNPCKHPIIILKDVTFNIMCELLEFMYQGVVNVKHTELQSFMKIGQLLQIKGLATNASTAGATSTDKTASQTHNADEASSVCADAENNSSATSAKTGPNHVASDDVNASDGLSGVKLSHPISVKSHSPASSPSPMSFAESAGNANQQNFKSSPESNLPLHANYHTGANLKRHADLNNDALSIYSRKQFRRSIASADHNTDHSDSADADAESDYFLPSIPHLASNSSAAVAAAAFRGTFNPAAFGFDYNLYKNSSASGSAGIGGACGGNTSGGGPEYPNDLHIPSDYSKNFANHVDIPPNSSNVVMLSSTSLLHGSCVFNRNNTVATQQGMKTYWLCKSYRISMCRARCITHQGRVISATGVHNHPPHMRGSGPGGGMGNSTGGNSHAGGVGNSSGFPIDVNAQQPSAAATSSSSTINLNSFNMSGVLLPGGANSAVNVSSASGARLHHTTASGAIGTSMYQQHNSMHNSPAQQLHLHQQQQQLHQQQQQLNTVGGGSTPPPMSAGLMGNSHHAHTTQSATSLLMSHHSAPDNVSMAANVHQHHHHQHHTIGGSGNSAMGGAGSGSQNLHSNSVIQNILHSANASNAMHHHHHPQLPHMSHLSQHQHHQQHEPHLEITPLMQSPPLPPPPPLHLQSPSNLSNQSQHGSGGANSLSSPITTTPAATGSGGALKSPTQTNLSDEAIRVSEPQSHSAHLSEQHQHLLSHGTTLSPSEINSSTAVSADGANEAQLQAHVIDSITISPSEVAPGEHWFHGKLEFMLSQRGKPLLVHDGHTFGIQYVRKDKKYWQCNLSRKFNCKARVTTTDTGEIIVTNNEHCHTEIRQHLRKDYQRNKVMMNALLNLSTNIRRQSSNGNNTNSLNNLSNFTALATHGNSLLNAAATAAAMSVPGSGSLQGYHNECLDQQQQLTPGVVDFRKDRSTNSPSSCLTTNTHNQTLIDDHEDTPRPLDCGFRQSTTTTGPNEFDKDVNSHDSNYNGATWKCKNEIGDS